MPLWRISIRDEGTSDYSIFDGSHTPYGCWVYRLYWECDQIEKNT